MMPPSLEQQPYQQPYQQPPPYVPPPMTAGPRGFLNKGTVMVLAMVGIIMFFVGLMILSSSAFIEPASGSSSDYDAYQDTMRNMRGSGQLVIEIGGLLACIGLVCGGISADDVTDKIRAVMVSAGIAVVIATLVVLGLFGSLGTL